MILAGLSNALRGIGGEYELTRVVGAGGGFSYIVGANAFVAWNMVEGREFDITAYCIAFPGGLAAILVAIAGGAGLKDRNVAVAKQTESRTRTDAAAAHALAGTSTDEAADAAEETAEAAVDKAVEIKDKGRG